MAAAAHWDKAQKEQCSLQWRFQANQCFGMHGCGHWTGLGSEPTRGGDPSDGDGRAGIAPAYKIHHRTGQPHQ
eukprot:6174297-Pleurochrysis_carterae.AAC.1